MSGISAQVTVVTFEEPTRNSRSLYWKDWTSANWPSKHSDVAAVGSQTARSCERRQMRRRDECAAQSFRTPEPGGSRRSDLYVPHAPRNPANRARPLSEVRHGARARDADGGRG